MIYGRGQTIAVDVTWTTAVAWDVSASGAGIGVRLLIGSTIQRAELVTGGRTSGTARTLRFTYRVAAGDSDTDGVEVATASQSRLVLLRGGATLKMASKDTVNAAVTHAGLDAQAGHKVNGSSTAPGNSAPTYGGSSPGQVNAPPLTRVNVAVNGNAFTDADGDPLTLTLSASRDDTYVSGGLELVQVTETQGRLFFTARASCVLANLSPAVSSPHLTTATLTATDPDGASAAVTARFRTPFSCPSVSSAAVDGATLTVTLGGNAEGTSPGADEFEVKVDGTAVALADSSPVAVSGSTATLTLAAAVTFGQTVTVSYTPDADALAADTLAASPMSVAFSDQAVTNDTNTVPTVANPIPDQTVSVAKTFSYQFPADTFSDADGDTLTYTATQGNGGALPSFLTFDAATRTFSGTAPNLVFTLPIKVTASDGIASVSDTFDLAVTNAAPTVANPIPDQVATVGVAFSYTIPADTFHDADGHDLEYSAFPVGGTVLPSWLTFSPATRTISGTPQSGNVGTLSVQVVATDNVQGTTNASDTFDLVVSTGPAISSVAIASKPRIDADGDGTKETYGRGQRIAVDVTWNTAVAWDVSASGAGMAVQLGIGSNTRQANLVTGGATGGTTRTLRFAYTVQAADTDSDGRAGERDHPGRRGAAAQRRDPEEGR